MKTFTHICGDWHFWQGTQFMASNEAKKELHAFATIDECITWLFVNRHYMVARSLNAAKLPQR